MAETLSPSAALGKERPKTLHSQKRIDLRDGHSRTGGAESQCGVDSERAYKEMSRNAKETAPGSPEHTLILLTLLYPLLMSACLLVTAPKLRTPILGER